MRSSALPRGERSDPGCSATNEAVLVAETAKSTTKSIIEMTRTSTPLRFTLCMQPPR